MRIGFVSLLAAASTAAAGAANRVPGGFIVELADGHTGDSVVSSVGGASKRMDLDFKLFKGVSLQVHDVDKADEKAAKIAALPAVKRVWPIQVVKLPDENVRVVGNSSLRELGPRDAADVFAPHVMTQVDKLRGKGITGKGVKVAVVDTGVDYTHPALGGCFGADCLVSFGTDLVGDAYTGYNTPQPDADPMDCNGHGSHVSGIIAAKPNEYGFTGAAPGVRLGMYRVFGCDGQASTDILIAAFSRAFEDGADIITASIVGAAGWSEEPWAVVAQRIVEQGVPCTISAGNDGDHGLFYSSNAADAKGVISVASYDNVVTPVLSYDATYTVDGASSNTTFPYVEGDPGSWGVTLPVYATSLDSTVADDACSPLPDSTPDLSGQIVLVRRGGCLFDDKVRNLVPKGAQYVLIYNNVDGIFAPSLSAQKGNIKSIGMTDAKTGVALAAALKAGKKVVANVPNYLSEKAHLAMPNNTLTGGGLSLFTSWGPNWEMDFKPQIGAPGGNILSTYPLAKGGYAVLSGTSMSCPITAAIIALISEVRGTLDPRTIEDLLSATANPQLFNDGTKFYDKLAPAAQQGGGLVQAFDAAYTTTTLYPSSMSFNDTDHFAASLNFTITNKGGSDITYSLGHVPALTMYTLASGSIYPAKFPNEAVDSYASLSFSQDKVTLPAGHRSTINVSPTAPGGVDAQRLPLWSGYVTVNGSDGSSLSIPYQGLSGSLHKAKVLASDQSWIFNSNDSTAYTRVPDNTTFTLPAPGTAGDSDVLPAVYVNLALGSPLLRIDVVPLTTCPPNTTAEVLGVKSIGQPFGLPSPYDSRGVSWWSWDGKLDSGDYAPPGKYKFVSRALRIFGDAKNKAEYDVAETQGFKIRYK